MSVFIIAEAGVNHNGDVALAKKLIDAAKDAGADAVKFQSFKAGHLVTRLAEKASYQTANTGNQDSQYEMLKLLELSAQVHRELFEYCMQREMLFLSTPFDIESADLLEDLGLPIYKISSGDMTNTPFLKHLAKKGKPLILSTGMSSLGEVEEALTAVYSTGNSNVSLLHCTTDYPARYEEINLRAMLTMKEAFKLPVGYSDHTDGYEISLAAVAMGAAIIEKHFTLDRTLPGPDHKASLEPCELAQMICCIRNIEKSFGSGIKTITESEKAIVGIVRKSLVTRNPIGKGQVISEADIVIKRPATGIAPRHYDEIIGRTVRNDMEADVCLQWTDIN